MFDLELHTPSEPDFEYYFHEALSVYLSALDKPADTYIGMPFSELELLTSYLKSFSSSLKKLSDQLLRPLEEGIKLRLYQNAGRALAEKLTLFPLDTQTSMKFQIAAQLIPPNFKPQEYNWYFNDWEIAYLFQSMLDDEGAIVGRYLTIGVDEEYLRENGYLK